MGLVTHWTHCAIDLSLVRFGVEHRAEYYSRNATTRVEFCQWRKGDVLPLSLLYSFDIDEHLLFTRHYTIYLDPRRTEMNIIALF